MATPPTPPATTTGPSPAAPPWVLTKPGGGTAVTVDGIEQSINASGEYRLVDSGTEWQVSRTADPPQFMEELDWRLTAFGIVGQPNALQAHAASWPAMGGADRSNADAGLAMLESGTNPTTATELAVGFKNVNDVLLLAPLTDIPGYAERLGRVLLRWYPNGQLLAWARSYQYIQSGRPGHLLAGAALSGLDAVGNALTTARGGIWFRGENIETSHPGALYCCAFNGINLPAVAFEIPTFTFIFEFGMNVTVDPPLDFLSVRHLHSLPVLDYVPRDLREQSPTLLPGLSEQEAFRSWFLRKYNALCDTLIRWESFMTTGGELRPVVLQQTNMTVARILNTTAFLMASQERSAQLHAFWSILDLVGGLTGGGIERVMGNRFWTNVVQPSLSRLPAPLNDLFYKYAVDLYAELIDQVRGGVTDSRRLRTGHVHVPYSTGDRPENDSDFLARYMRVRRNTLHSYDLNDDVNRAFLSIHDGSLPQRLPEWARMVYFALLANPEPFIGRLRVVPA
jgi:hypothetical protein